MRTTVGVIAICLLLAGSLFAAGTEEQGKKAGKDIKMEIICMGFQHEYWQTVRLGSEKAAKEIGIQVPFRGPELETQVDVQIGMFENAMAKKVDGILLAPCDSEALVPLVDRATEQGIVVATFDTDINKTDNRISFIATDNYAAGKLAGQNAGRILGGKGKVGIVGHLAPNQDTRERIGGFVDVIKAEFPGIQLLEPVYGDGDHQKSLDKATDMMRAHPDLAAIYATNEGGAVGVALALEQAKKVGQVKLIGFDSSEQEIDYLKRGVIEGFVVQNPFQMGYLAVKTLYEHLAGIKQAPARIDTGVLWVDMDNFNDADIQKVLYPLK
jgi:ribose transport system substrate-binding protein